MPRKGKLLVSEAIAQLAPGASFSLHNEDHSTLKWTGQPPAKIPTLKEVNDLIAAYVAPPTVLEQIETLREQVKRLTESPVKSAVLSVSSSERRDVVRDPGEADQNTAAALGLTDAPKLTK